MNREPATESRKSKKRNVPQNYSIGYCSDFETFVLCSQPKLLPIIKFHWFGQMLLNQLSHSESAPGSAVGKECASKPLNHE